MFDMRRREVITLLGGAAAAWPLAAQAQQAAMPVIGFLGSQSAETVADYLRAFRQGLKDAGYIEGETITVEYRWAEGQVDRLPDLVADLARRRGGRVAARSSRAAIRGSPAHRDSVSAVGKHGDTQHRGV